MFKDDKSLILFGRSPFINEIADYIPELCNKYHTIGCNYFVNSFPMVENVIFYDDITPTVTENNRIITNILYRNDNTKKCFNLLREHKNKELYVIIRNHNAFSKVANRLHFCIHTPSMALNWAWKKDFRNVILAGIDLTLDNRLHFDKDTTPDADTNDFNKGAIFIARRHLKEVAQRHLNLYQLNKNSDLDIEKIDIKDLLKSE